MPFRSEEEEDDLFDQVTAMADRMGLEGEKRAVYIDDHMLQGGYTRVQSRESYARMRPEKDEDESGSNRWGFGSRNSGGPGKNRDEGDRF